MAYDPEFEIYKGKPIGSLFQDIVSCSENRRNQIDILISDIRSMIKTPENAMMMVPLIKDYMDVGVKNDDQLVKLAAIVQRILNGGSAAGEEGAGFGFTDEEKKQLLQQVDDVVQSQKERIPDKPDKISDKPKTE